MINYNNSSLPIASSVASDKKGSPLPSITRRPGSHVATKIRFANRQIGDFLPKQYPSKSRIISSLLVVAVLANVVDMAVALEFNPETDCFDFSLDISSAIPVQFGSPTYEHTHSLSRPAPMKNADSRRGLGAQTMGKKKLKKLPKYLTEYEKTKLCIDYEISLQKTRRVEKAKAGKTGQGPTQSPSQIPSLSTIPSRIPSSAPSNDPSSNPSDEPSNIPSSKPSLNPSSQPSLNPSSQPSLNPSNKPSLMPSSEPSLNPSSQPSLNPSSQPSLNPSNKPSLMPSSEPSLNPSSRPSMNPSSEPSSYPSSKPSSYPSSKPSSNPSPQPSLNPSSKPSFLPSEWPSTNPSKSLSPSDEPSHFPSRSSAPSGSCASPSLIGNSCDPPGAQTNGHCCYSSSSPFNLGCVVNNSCNNCALGLVSAQPNSDIDCCFASGSSYVTGTGITRTCIQSDKYCCKVLNTGAPSSRYRCFNDSDIPSGETAESFCSN